MVGQAIAKKAKKKLGWRARFKMRDVVRMMVEQNQ
jgi:GDP-D-mannose dehydratase